MTNDTIAAAEALRALFTQAAQRSVIHLDELDPLLRQLQLPEEKIRQDGNI